MQAAANNGGISQTNTEILKSEGHQINFQLALACHYMFLPLDAAFSRRKGAPAPPTTALG